MIKSNNNNSQQPSCRDKIKLSEDNAAFLSAALEEM